MSTNTKVSGARKRKLSTKASTNGDPLEAKRKKTLSSQKKGVALALTKKKKTSTAWKEAPKSGTVDEDDSGEAADGGDNASDTHDIISIDDDDDKMDDETNLEVAEECAETKLGRILFYISK